MIKIIFLFLTRAFNLSYKAIRKIRLILQFALTESLLYSYLSYLVYYELLECGGLFMFHPRKLQQSG